MLKNTFPEAGFSNSRLLLAVFLSLSGIFLTVLSFARTPREIADLAKTKNSIVAKPAWRGPLINPTQIITTSNSSGPGWSIVNSPNEGADKWNFLSDVACISANDCWAVGAHRNDSGFDQTLVEHWNGAEWSIIPSPNSSAQNNYLWSVTCLSQNECWAVGNYSNGSAMQTQIEHWDGGSWTIVSSPNMSTQNNYLSGISCVNAGECWAVGSYDSGSDHQTLVERWDGDSWSIIPSPNSSQKSRFFSITCLSETDCWVVGGDLLGSTLIEHWDGNSWSIVTSPVTNGYAVLISVVCPSWSQCWAVGYYYTGYGDPLTITSRQTLIERWDGTSWAIATSPAITAQESFLAEVACPTAQECWAVGESGYKSLVEHWNGTSWSITPSPNPAGFPGNLIGVACASASECFSVGQQYANPRLFVSQTFIEEYAPTVPPLISVGSRMTHGTAGAFDVDLPLTGKRGVECRSGGPNGNYSVVFTFVNDVNNCGTAATPGGSVVAGPNSNQCTENLNGVANAQYITVELDNVIDAQNNTGNVAVQLGVLIGDTNADGFVDAIDVSQTKSQSGNVAGSSNFREDINLDGFVDSIDTSFVKSKSGTSLPSSP